MTKLLRQSILLLILLTAVSLRGEVYAAGQMPGIEAEAKVDAQIQSALLNSDSPTIDVIIRKTSADIQLDAVIEQLGGTVTHDLPIINSVAATVPNEAV